MAEPVEPEPETADIPVSSLSPVSCLTTPATGGRGGAARAALSGCGGTRGIARRCGEAHCAHARALAELWEQEQRAARRKLEPEGALTGATRELQAGLGAFLSICHEHGVKVGPWRLQHVVPEWTFGDHPTYGAVTIAHWACKDGQPWKVGIGLFLARGAGKPKDLEIKLAVMDTEPAMVDHLILLRPEDDLTLTGKSKTLWHEAERRGKHARLEPVSLDGVRAALQLPALARGRPRIAARRHAAAEPRRPDSGEVREAARTGLHAGAGLTTDARLSPPSMKAGGLHFFKSSRREPNCFLIGNEHTRARHTPA